MDFDKKEIEKKIRELPLEDFKACAKIILSLFESYGKSHSKIYTDKDEIYNKPVTGLVLNTIGLSDREFIISELQNNFLFWNMYWYSETRGGHFIFKDRYKKSDGEFVGITPTKKEKVFEEEEVVKEGLFSFLENDPYSIGG